MTQVDPTDVGGHVEADEREPGDWWLEPRVNSASVVADPHFDTRGTMIVMLPQPV